MSYSYSQKRQNRFRDNNRKPFYYIRKGATLPDGLKVLHVSDDILRCWNQGKVKRSRVSVLILNAMALMRLWI